MAGPESFQTLMGRKFYDGTLPRIATALERIADALEHYNGRIDTALQRAGQRAEAHQGKPCESWRDNQGCCHICGRQLDEG